LAAELLARADAEGLSRAGSGGLLAGLAIGVTVEGERDIFGLWAAEGGEGAKYWAHVLSEIARRAVADVCALVRDALAGLPDAPACVCTGR